MNKFLLLSVMGAAMSSSAHMAAENPVADPRAVVQMGDARFTVLTPELLRIEWRSDSTYDFVDDASFTIINREMPVPSFTTSLLNGDLLIETDKLVMQYRIGTKPSPETLKITFDLNGKKVEWHPGMKDELNLKGTTRTLDGANGDSKRSELEDGLISRSGWALIDETAPRGDDSRSLLFTKGGVEGMDWWRQRPDSAGIDWYFLGYGHDYKKALNDYTLIAGKIPMIPLYAFGYWYSKYEKYTEDDFMTLVDDMEANGVPLDVMVVDMGWHKEQAPDGGWTGWSWDKDYFPAPASFLKKLHDRNLKVTLNLHPADGVAPYEDGWVTMKNTLTTLGYDLNGGSEPDGRIKWNLKDSTFTRAFLKDIIGPLEDDGVDFWWIDWQQDPFQIEGLSSTFWLNHVFYNHMAATHPDKRPIIFHRWGGLGNHRYQLGFSGDSHSNFETLAFEPYFTATAANVGYGYWGHDLGGHFQPCPNNPELYLRWLQYGAFSPLLRTHSTSNLSIERRIWKYDNFEDMNAAFKLRYAMVPYIYTQSRKAYDSGLSLCRPLYYDSPEAEEAYMHEGEYMFGDDILVNPITKASVKPDKSVEQSTWLPAGLWYDVNRGKLLQGDAYFIDTYAHNEIPYFYRAGAIIPNYPPVTNLKSRPDTTILLFAPGADGSTRLYEDDGDTEGYKRGEYAFTTISRTLSPKQSVITISPAEGSYSGMPANRQFQLKLLSAQAPRSVKVNGHKTDWHIDNTGNCVIIDLPAMLASQEIKVTIDNHK